jgi:HSP20 family protein
MLSFPEVNELSDDVRRVFEELDRQHGASSAALTGVFTPALDVVETPTSVEVFVDLPGVTVGALRVLFKNGALIIAGEKLGPEQSGPDCAAYHLVERGFGRFARVIRLGLAIDAGRTTARLLAGELRVSIPRITERRGEEIPVRVEPSPA